MGKIFDITNKLKFDERPELKVGGRVMRINNSAKNVLMFIEESREISENPAAMGKAAKLLFDEDDWNYIMNDLQLNMEDFTSVLNAAVTLAQGGDPEEDGNGQENESGF